LLEEHLDLSFARFDRGSTVTTLPTELAVLLAAATGRQAATPTARLQTRLAWNRAPVSLLNPADGAFNGWTAALLRACVVPEHRPVAKGWHDANG
jgi:hypothetical protein